MQKPLVSIIIPTFNRVHLIGETLDSIIGQTYSNWECIVIDDGSSDETKLLLQNYTNKDIRIHYDQRPKDRLKGANACRNFGFEKCKGKLINWFDSDDIMEKDFLLNAVNHFKNQNSLDFVLFDYATFENSLDKIVVEQKNETNNLIEDYATWKINCATPSIIWKRNLVKNYRFDENLFRAQELDFNLRIFFNEKYSYQCVNKIGCYVRIHAQNLTSDFNKMNIKSLISEFKVRKYLIDNLIDRKTSKDVVIGSIIILTITFRKMYRGNHFKLFFKSINSSINFKRGNFSETFWYFKFMILLALLILVNRGDIQMKNHLYKIPFGNINFIKNNG